MIGRKTIRFLIGVMIMTIEEAKVIMAKRKQCGVKDFYDCKLMHKVSCIGCVYYVTNEQVEEAIDIILATFEKENRNDS